MKLLTRIIMTCAVLIPTVFAQNDQNVLLRKFVGQLADGDSWKTSFTLVNGGTGPIGGILRFFDDSGRPLTLSMRQGQFAQSSDSIQLSVLAKGSATVETSGLGPILNQGYATFTQTLGSGAMRVFAVFGQHVAGRADFEATVEAAHPGYRGYGIPFQNTNGYSLGLAILNPDSISGDFLLAAYDEAGNRIASGVISLDSLRHTVFSLPDRFPETANRRGYIEISRIMSGVPPSAIVYPYLALTALRFNPTGSFSVAPTLPLQ